jgi:hypothetical protein
MYRQLWEAQTRQRARLVAARSAIADVGQVDDVGARAGGVS